MSARESDRSSDRDGKRALHRRPSHHAINIYGLSPSLHAYSTNWIDVCWQLLTLSCERPMESANTHLPITYEEKRKGNVQGRSTRCAVANMSFHQYACGLSQHRHKVSCHGCWNGTELQVMGKVMHGDSMNSQKWQSRGDVTLKSRLTFHRSHLIHDRSFSLFFSLPHICLFKLSLPFLPFRTFSFPILPALSSRSLISYVHWQCVDLTNGRLSSYARGPV